MGSSERPILPLHSSGQRTPEELAKVRTRRKESRSRAPGDASSMDGDERAFPVRQPVRWLRLRRWYRT
jgi:hypothetical protein